MHQKKVDTKKYRLFVGGWIVLGMIVWGVLWYFSEKKETMFGLGLWIWAMVGSLLGIILYIKLVFKKK